MSNVVGVIVLISVPVILSGVATFAFSPDFEHVCRIAEEILDGDLVARP